MTRFSKTEAQSGVKKLVYAGIGGQEILLSGTEILAIKEKLGFKQTSRDKNIRNFA